jgi:hypothetical protein
VTVSLFAWQILLHFWFLVPEIVQRPSLLLPPWWRCSEQNTRRTLVVGGFYAASVFTAKALLIASDNVFNRERSLRCFSLSLGIHIIAEDNAQVNDS